MSSYNVEKFNLDNLCKPTNICIIGKSGSGKTTLIKNIINHINTKLNQNGVIISLDRFTDNTLNNQDNKLKYLILDDFTNPNNKLMDDNLMNSIINNRHYKVINIITFNCSDNIYPYLINNFNYIFIFKDNIENTKNKLWKLFGSMFETFTEFSKYIDLYTSNFNTMVIDNTNKSAYWLENKYHN